MIEIKNCPFCGSAIDPSDPDSIHPSGIGWKDTQDGRVYVSHREAPKEQWCYQINCVCGVEMHSDSVQGCIEMWNTRVIEWNNRQKNNT